VELDAWGELIVEYVFGIDIEGNVYVEGLILALLLRVLALGLAAHFS
jgi:hypothetical protein